MTAFISILLLLRVLRHTNTEGIEYFSMDKMDYDQIANKREKATENGLKPSENMWPYQYLCSIKTFYIIIKIFRQMTINRAFIWICTIC